MWRYQGPTRAAQCHVNVPHSTHIRFVQVAVVLLVSTGVSVAEIIRQLKDKLEDMESISYGRITQLCPLPAETLNFAE